MLSLLLSPLKVHSLSLPPRLTPRQTNTPVNISDCVKQLLLLYILANGALIVTLALLLLYIAFVLGGPILCFRNTNIFKGEKNGCIWKKWATCNPYNLYSTEQKDRIEKSRKRAFFYVPEQFEVFGVQFIPVPPAKLWRTSTLNLQLYDAKGGFYSNLKFLRSTLLRFCSKGQETGRGISSSVDLITRIR